MPASVTLSNIGWSAPDGAAVLSGLDFRFTPERIGLVGRNGVGKSTLLGLIGGQREPATGHVTTSGTIATLRQTVQVGPDETLADLFGARPALALLARADSGAATMDELDACDWTLPARIEEALAQVHLDLRLDTPLAHLSGGQRTRAALAGAIFDRPDFLLLDEPTNNLDSDGRDALLDLLTGWRGGAIVVSHDRALLERMDAIAELTTLGLTRYGGNWSAYRMQKAQELAAAEQDVTHAEKQVRIIAQKAQVATERQQRRDAAGARKGAKGDMPRILIGARRQQAEASRGDGVKLADRQRQAAADMLHATREKIEKMEVLTVTLASSALAAHRRILALDRVTLGHDPAAPILRDINVSVIGPERIAITGPNGAGKSTLLHAMAGRITPLSGSIQRPVACALLDQRADLLDPALSIADNFARLHPTATRNVIHAALARFHFRADRALQRVETLSGGQMLRAALACLLGGDNVPPLLLLDEPTNHLDIESIEAIEQGLVAYDGALIVVSHDRTFLEAIGIGREVRLPQ